jgi:putative transposase
MGRKRDFWDNAVVESFFHALKTEMTCFEDFENRTEAKNRIFK